MWEEFTHVSYGMHVLSMWLFAQMSGDGFSAIPCTLYVHAWIDIHPPIRDPGSGIRPHEAARVHVRNDVCWFLQFKLLALDRGGVMLYTRTYTYGSAQRQRGKEAHEEVLVLGGGGKY